MSSLCKAHYSLLPYHPITSGAAEQGEKHHEFRGRTRRSAPITTACNACPQRYLRSKRATSSMLSRRWLRRGVGGALGSRNAPWHTTHGTRQGRRETVLSYLDGPAQVEIDLLPLPTQACAEKLIEAVVTAFGDKRSTGALRDALYTRNQRPHESVRDYSNALLSLFGLLRTKTGEENPVTQTALSERFVEGLHSGHLKTKFRRLLSSEHPPTFSSLRNLAIDRDEEESNNIHLASAAAISTQPALENQLQTLASTVADLKTAVERLQSPPAPRQSCTYCHRLGHAAADCRTRQRNEANYAPASTPRDRQCYHCNRWGHMQRNCPLLRRQPVSRPEPAARQTSQAPPSRQPQQRGSFQAPRPQARRQPHQRQGNFQFPQ